MRQVCITVTPHANLDVRGIGVVAAAPTVGVEDVRQVRVSDLYFVRGELTDADIHRLCESVLADPAAHKLAWEPDPPSTPPVMNAQIEVAYLPGVMDPLALQLARAAGEIGLPPIEVATATRYQIDAPRDVLKTLAERLLYNATVQRYAIGRIEAQFVAGVADIEPHVESIPLDGLDETALVALSKTRLLSLSLDEMCAIQSYFRTAGRAPTDVELEALAQTWSEHCVHKTFKALIDYTNAEGKVEVIDGLLKSTIRKATEEINAPWVRSAFVDNAGIIAFNDGWDLSFKVETHNHPSALEPFGGANTGVGGVIRDIMGVSARPIAVTDILCFGPQDLAFEQLPTGTLHPRRIKAGVVSGVADYGNKLGIPNVSGAVYYDPGYTANPLVFAGCVGIAPRGSHPTGARPGDRVIVLGGRTGRDGIHGATFSSDALAHNTGQVVGTAVQIGNPIVEKDVMEVLLRARDARLYTAITDCGAGGLSSAVGEMAQHPGGVAVDLSAVPLKYAGLLPWEIWLSEAQERMVIAIPSENWSALKALCDEWDVEVTDIGVFTDGGRLVVKHAESVVADLELGFLHDGLPRLHLKATANPKPFQWQVSLREPQPGEDFKAYLLRLLADPNLNSKENIIRRYDHEVRAGTVVKPLVGADYDGPGDGSVVIPLETREQPGGFALGVGLCNELADIDPYRMARAAVNEAIANVVAVGADPDQIALLDNFCWGDPKNPARLGALVEAARGCYDAALEENRAPFISGKDSLNNMYIGLDGSRTNIPDTLVISAIGIVPDIAKVATMDLKQAGHSLYLYAANLNTDRREFLRNLYQFIQMGQIAACHNISTAMMLCPGGIPLSLAKMCLAGELGAKVDFTTFAELMSPVNGTNMFILEGKQDLPTSQELTRIGEITSEPRLVFTNATDVVLDVPVAELKAAYKGRVQSVVSG